jgi:FkbM family methyltransferase
MSQSRPCFLSNCFLQTRTFLDLGANIGYYSLVAARLNPRLSIIAFEPNYKLFKVLEENIRTNRFAIQAEPSAVSSVTGTKTLYLTTSDMAGSLDPCFAGSHVGQACVRTLALDDFCKDIELPDPMIVKFDIEGHEEAAIKGARQTISARRPDIILEVSRSYGMETETWLRDNGYAFYQIGLNGFQPTEHLAVNRRGNIWFLNYLVTTRDSKQVRDIFDKVAVGLAGVDIEESSEVELVSKLEAREAMVGRVSESPGVPRI